jgi:hypothetical protein
MGTLIGLYTADKSRQILAEFRVVLNALGSRPLMARLWTLPGALLVVAVATAAHGQGPSKDRAPSVAPVAPAPATPATPTPQWPKTLPDPKAAPSPNEWSKLEIEEARAQCKVILTGIEAVTLPADPVREGDCGAPAPVELISVGSNPQVTFSPPAVVTCDMVAALDRWFKSDVQPAARSMLGGPVVRVETMSSYSCRNAYNRKKTKLSEHGRANALDIRGFLTDRGDTTTLLADWGLTERDIRAQIAAAKAEAARQEVKRQEQLKEAAKNEAARRAASEAAKAIASPSDGPGPGRFAGSEMRGSFGNDSLLGPREPQALGLTSPSRLGGPKSEAPGQAALPATQVPTNKERFLKRIHASACRTFGTVLGPEANEAHRNHFHLDMAERQSGSYCE